jgi:hypothetical protein
MHQSTEGWIFLHPSIGVSSRASLTTVKDLDLLPFLNGGAGRSGRPRVGARVKRRVSHCHGSATSAPHPRHEAVHLGPERDSDQPFTLKRRGRKSGSDARLRRTSPGARPAAARPGPGCRFFKMGSLADVAAEFLYSVDVVGIVPVQCRAATVPTFRAKTRRCPAPHRSGW